MDKADWALLISIGSFVAAAASAFYTRRMVIQDAKKMARKAPILSLTEIRPLQEWRGFEGGGETKEYPGYFSVSFSVTNREPHLGLRLISLDVRGGARIAKHSDLVPDPSQWERVYLPDELPANAFKSHYELGYNLQPNGTPRHASGKAGDTTLFTVYANKQVSPKNFDLRWEWLDGQKN